MTSPLKVSVVAAVYNSGPAIANLVHSLDAQTMPTSDFEVLLIDDGSTDDTLDLIRDLAQSRPYLGYETIPNSGWPGRPRNIGTDRSRGEYVFFADHDDEFFPRALEELYATAVRNSADVVYGKVIRVGSRTPYWSLARADLPVADPVADRLLVSRTTHKLYRREFLTGHGIRFLEGRVRLEDHNFMGQVLAERPVVSVLMSVPCYRWIHRNDGTNASTIPFDTVKYLDYFSSSVRLLQQGGPADPLYRVAAYEGTDRMFVLLSPDRWPDRPADDQQLVVEEMAAFLRGQVPPDVDAELGWFKELALRTIRQVDLTALNVVQHARAQLRTRTHDVRLAWVDGALRISAQVTLCDTEGRDVLVEDRDGVPVLVDGPLCELLADVGVRPGAPLAQSWDAVGSLELTVKHRVSGVEWPLPVTQQVVRPSDGPGPLRVTCAAVIRPDSGWFGQELEEGDWRVLARSELLGHSWAPPVLQDEQPDLELPQELVECGPREAFVYWRNNGQLFVKVGAPGLRPPWVPTPVLAGATWQADQLEVELAPSAVVEDGSVLLTRVRGTERTSRHPITGRRAVLGTAQPLGSGEVLDLYVQPGGQGSLELRLAFGEPSLHGTAALELYRTVKGFVSVRPRPVPVPPPHVPLGARVARRLRRAAATVSRRS